MARSDWGGGNDLSGLFSSLQDQFQSQVQGATNRQMQRTAEQQGAADNDAYDRWTNGLLDDAGWLAYIQERVQQTAGDPKEHDVWVETYRKHHFAIEDSQLESEYQAGTLGIGDLIDHYAGRMNNVLKNSPEYRQMQDKYYNFLDKRDGDNISHQADIIIDQIDRGQTGYETLLNFYKARLKGTRASSPLYGQIQSQILSIGRIVDGVSGGSGGGGGGGGGGRGGSSGGGGSDSAAAGGWYELANAILVKKYRSGSVFLPTRGIQVAPDGSLLTSVDADNDAISIFDVFDVGSSESAILNAMHDDNDNIARALQQAIDNPSQATLTTDYGPPIANTPENRQNLIAQGLQGLDMKKALEIAADRSTAGTQGDIDTFITRFVQHENSLSFDKQWDIQRQDVWEQLELASSTADPLEAQRIYQRAAKSMHGYVRHALGLKNMDPKYVRMTNALRKSEEVGAISGELDTTDLPSELQLEADTRDELNYWDKITKFFIDNHDDPQAAMTAGSILSSNRPEGFFLSEDQLAGIIGTDIEKTSASGTGEDTVYGTGYIGKMVQGYGLQVEDMVRNGAQDVDTADRYVMVAKSGQKPHAMTRKAAEQGGYLDGATSRMMMERVSPGGDWQPVHFLMEDVPDATWIADEQGNYVTTADLKEFGVSDKSLADNHWKRVPIDELAGWKKIDDGSGRIYYINGKDGHMFLNGIPYRVGEIGGVSQGDIIKSNGKLNISLVEDSTAQGFYMGVGGDMPAKESQRWLDLLMASGDIDPTSFHNRDKNGVVSNDPITPEDAAGQYWSPGDAALPLSRPSKGGHGAKGWGKGQDNTQDLMSRSKLRREAVGLEREQQIAMIREARRNPRIQQDATDTLPGIREGAVAAGISLGTQQFNVKLPTPTIPHSVAPLPTVAEPKATPPVALPATRPVATERQIGTAPVGSRYAGKPLPF